LGGGRVSATKRLLFVTESRLIQLSADTNFWNKVSVVIVDEAHERNLTTDIVVGILKKR
jgi:HrpA-like RNA helicase